MVRCKNTLHSISIAVLLATASFQASAQLFCHNVHHTLQTSPQKTKAWEEQTLTDFKGHLDPNKLAAQGFRLSENNELFDLRAADPQKSLGKLQTLEAPYLFHWTSKDEYSGILKGGGVSDDYMRVVINAPGQTSGKGFYISTDPFDSKDYGNDVIVLRPQGPLVVLQLEGAALMRCKADVDFVDRLSNAGIESLRFAGYKKSWHSIISNKHLQKSSGFPADVLVPYLQSGNNPLERELTALSRLTVIPPESLKRLPPNHILRRADAGKLNGSDLKELIHKAQSYGDDFYNNYESLLDSLVLNRFIQVKDVQEATILLQLMREKKWPLTLYGTVQNMKASRPSEKMNLYLSILDIYDIRAVATLAQPTGLAEPVDLNVMKQEAQQYEKNLKSVDLKSIHHIEDFLSAAEKIYGFRPHFRNKPVLMGENLKSSGQPIELDENLANRLKENPLLTVKPSPDGQSSSGQAKVHVEYWNLEKMEMLLPLLSEGLKSRVEPVLKNPGSIDPFSPENRKLLEETLKEVTEALLDFEKSKYKPLAGQYLRGIFDYYKVFISLHPFDDGNGRLARLYYQILMQRYPHMTNGSIGKIMDLTTYDLDLFVNPSDLSEQQVMGSILKLWVAQAQTDPEFILRSKWAMELYFRLYPQWRSQFPKNSTLQDP